MAAEFGFHLAVPHENLRNWILWGFQIYVVAALNLLKNILFEKVVLVTHLSNFKSF